MTDLGTPPAAPLSAAPSARRERKRRPPFAFWKGATLGVLVVIPLCALAVWVLARCGVGNPSASMIECLRIAVLFSGLAAIVTAGGVGRLSAQASIEIHRGQDGRRHAAWIGARAMAPGGAALTIIASIPLGGLPVDKWVWLAIAGGGALAGALSGALIGLLCGGPMPSLTELATWPLEAPIEWTRDLLGLEERAGKTEGEAPTEKPAEPKQ